MSSDRKPPCEKPFPPCRRGLELSREVLQAGGVDAMVARDAPFQRRLSDAQRAESLDATLAARPPGDVWLFGYGSLIWNPTIHSIERRVAHIDGWHRAFCLSVCAGRGSPDNPGLVLALDAGGACTGVAYRIAEGILRDELDLLWRREMVSGAYTPHWVDLVDPCAGGCFGRGIAFTIDPCAEQYAGGLAEDEVVRRLATASGALGSAADYLFRTCEGLRAHGIPDPELEHLASAVTERHELFAPDTDDGV